MRLSRKFTLLLAGTFVLPTVAMGVLGRAALTSTESRAGAEAGRVALAAERERLQQLCIRHASEIDAQLAQLETEVSMLGSRFEMAEPAAVTRTQRATVSLYPDKNTAGLPAYGFVEAKYGAYAEYLHRGPQSPWIPRWVLTRLAAEPSYRPELVAQLHRAADVGPLLAEIGKRHLDTVDLAWIVTTAGVDNVWPPYDYEQTISDNPDVLELDERAEDYVSIADPEHDPEHRARWTDPYIDRFKGVWMTSVVAPMYIDGAFQGTAGADLLLARITSEVLAFDLGGAGYPLLVGPRGQVIATTTAGADDLAWTPTYKQALIEAMKPAKLQGWTADREAALADTVLLAAPDEAVRRIAAAAAENAPGLTTVVLHDDARIVAHAPLATPGWGLVFVVPEASNAAKAAGVRTLIDDGADEVIQEFSVFALLVFGLSIVSAVLLQRLTIQPILSLGRRMSALTFDQLRLDREGPRVDDEIGQLEAKVEELLGLITRARDGERAEQEVLAATFRSLPEAVVTTDGDGRIQLLNPNAESLVGATTNAARGRHVSDILPFVRELDGTPLPDPIATILATGAATSIAGSIVLRLPTGDVVVDLRGAPTSLASGRGVVLVIRDLTEARRVEDELVRAQKLETVARLAAGIAHDFNNLLAGVLGYVSLARVLIPEDSAAQDRLARAEAAVDRARLLTLQLLTFSKGGEPVREESSLSRICPEAAAFVAHGSNCACDVQFPDEVWPVFVDRGQLGQVIQNLVLNATQAMPNGGTVWIRGGNSDTAPTALPSGRYVWFEVADHGIGIAPDHLPRVFDPFFTTKPKGSGLGLAVCFSIVRRHGGHIEVTSTLGVGTTVRVWLPAAPEATVMDETSIPSLPLGERVLFMDDDPDLREVGSAMLAGLGFRVTLASDGETAIRLYREAFDAGEPFVAALLDLTVPGHMGGREAVDHLHDLDPEVVAIVCSGYGHDPVLANPAAFGFRAGLHKPFTLGALRDVLVRALRKPARQTPRPD